MWKKMMMLLMTTPPVLPLPPCLLLEMGGAKLLRWSRGRRLAGPANSGVSGSHASHGCSPRMDAKSLLLSRATDKGGAHLSEEWMNGDVTSKTKNNLRKKIYKHRDSVAHNRAVELAETRKQAILPNQILAINANSPRDQWGKGRRCTQIRKSCAEIIGHIALEMQKKFVSNVKKAQSKISITIDESTVHGRAYMILYVRCDVTGKGDVDNVFLDLKELAQGTDAESIYNSLREALRDAGFDDEFLFINLISIATDGASVLTGKNIRKECETPGGGSSGVEYAALKIGQIFTIRWVSSSFRTVKAVWNNYPALASHFKVASEDPSRNDTERKKFLGLHKQLSNAGFVADLACMKDMLRPVTKVAAKGHRYMSANCQIQQCIDVLSAMKECVRAAVRLKGVSSISLFDNLKKRMPESDLVNMLKPLNKRFWPQDRNALILYGEKEIRALAKALGESASEAVQELRDWKLQDAAPAPGKTGETVHSKQNIPAHFIGVREGLFSCE
ncbi:hypothetical protein F7725_005092 [Dissostichus mawsoni]|uniref:Uncharacterized protein n=1 Tax=Dissostichus mawsoni TaxID=36200 RepID=A0A7J5YTF9_DISMA|nr:hypothetical protein F7725_005092 [Dissostichus mawsoni]